MYMVNRQPDTTSKSVNTNCMTQKRCLVCGLNMWIHIPD
jgi:hypothetical protein